MTWLRPSVCATIEAGFVPELTHNLLELFPAYDRPQAFNSLVWFADEGLHWASIDVVSDVDHDVMMKVMDVPNMVIVVESPTSTGGWIHLNGNS